MAKEGKSRKSLLIGVIAAVVILAGLLALVLTQCVGGQEDATTPTTTVATEPSNELALYWNVDRHNFEVVDDSLDTTGRKPADDGFYHVVFAKDGELIEFKVKERKIVRMIDGQDLMGLVFDADGVVIDIVRIDDMPIEKVAWQFYVQSIGGKTVKFNSAKEMTGMEVVVKLNDETKIYDMSGCSEFVGAPTELQKDDRCMVVANEDGDILYVFVYEREGVYVYETRWCEHCQKDVEWSSWPSGKALPTKPGHWFFTKDINMTEVALVEAEGNYCVDLAGYTVYAPTADNVRYGSYRVYDFYNTNNTKIMAIMDTSEGQTGKVVSNNKASNGVGGVIWLRGVNADECHIYGGTWDVTKIRDAAAGTGGMFARCNRGTLYIHGGVFDARGAKSGYGTLVDVANSFCVVNGGTFYGGEGFNFGGAAFTVQGGKLTINGGTIYGGTASKKGAGQGGAIGLSATKAEVEINGGVIYGGTAVYGGAIGNSGQVTMNGGTIIGGTSTGSGGGAVIVHAYGQGTASFTMNGGTITGGKQIDPAQGGGNVVVWNKNSTFTMNGGTITKGYSEGSKGGGVMVKAGAHFTLTGSPKIYGNTDKNGEPSNLLVDAKADFKIRNLRGGANIGILASGAFGTPNTVDYSGYFTADDGGKVIWINDANDPNNGKLKIGKFGCICGANEEGKHIGACDGTEHEWSPWAGASFPNQPGYWYMPKDGTFGETPLQYAADEDVVTKNIYVDLNGRDLKIASNSRIYRFFNYDKGQINVSFCDSSKDKSAKVTTTIKEISGSGLLFWLPNANNTNSVTIYSGYYDASSVITKSYGGMFEGSGGTINIYDGTFIGAEAQGSGGGVACLQSNMKMNMYGGTIKGGKATKPTLTSSREGGGAITLWGAGSELNMYGGTITGNSVTNGNGGGVSIRQGKLFVSGDAKIIGNTDAAGNPNNVYLDGNSALLKVGELTEGAEIGIKMSSGTGTFTVAGVDEANAKYFKADEGTLTVVATAGGLMLTDSQYPPQTNCLCGKDAEGNHFGDCDGTELTWMAWTSNNSLPIASGNFYLVGDVNMAAVALPDTRTTGQPVNINLDLNGFNVNGPVANEDGYKNNRIYDFAYATNSSVTITDTSDEKDSLVKVLPTFHGRGQIFWVRGNNNTLNLYGGTYDGKASAGGKIEGIFALVENNGTFNMFGGTADVSTVETTYGTGVAVLSGSTFNMEGGEILAGITTQTGGAGVYMAGGTTMNMSGGTISGGKGINGGNIYASGAAELNITGGKVINGAITSEEGNGSNIYWNGKGIVTLAGGTISGGAGGTGVYVANEDVQLTISGNTVITDNVNGDKPSNLALGEGVVIDLPEALGDEALIGISMAAPKDGYLAQGAGAVAEAVAKFVPDDVRTYEVVALEKGLILNVKGEEPVAPEERLPDYTLDPAKHCVCGMTINEEHFGDCDENMDQAWTEWTSTNSLPVEAGYYYLSADVTLTETQKVVLNDQAIYIDLNGKTVTGPDAAQVYNISKQADGTTAVTGSSLTITDSTWLDEGKIVTGNVGSAFATIAKDNTLNLYAGTIDGSKVNMNDILGGVVAANGNFNMYGGEIVGGLLKASKADPNVGGVAVFVPAGGKFTMDGGTINGGTVNGAGRVWHGSLVWISGEMTMNGGTITGGVANSGCGGNILIGTAGKFTMNGGTIENGQTRYDGGNIYAWDKSVVTINGGTISGGVAGRSGGNICMKTDSKKNDTVDAWSTLNLNGGEIVAGKAAIQDKGFGGGICVIAGYVNVSGNPVVADNTGSNFYFANGEDKTIAISGEGMTEGALVGVTLANTEKAFVTGEKATGANAAGFVSDNDAYQVVCLKDKGIQLADASVHYSCDCGAVAGQAHMGTCDGYDKDGWTAWDVAANGGKMPNVDGKFYIVDDANITSQLTWTQGMSNNITVDFNGKTLTVTHVVYPYSFQGGATVNLNFLDSVGGGGITIDNGGNNAAKVFNSTSTTSVINIYGGTYDCSKHSGGYGVVFYTKCPVNMYGGTIIGGTATNTGGGAICTEGSAAQFNMYGGTVTGGKFTGTSHGGGNIAMHGGKVTLNGGVISGGESNIRGGNIYIGSGEVIINEGAVVENGVSNCIDINVGDGSLNSTGNGGGNIAVNNAATAKLTINGGTVTGGQYIGASNDAMGGGNIEVDLSGVFVMNGGTVSNGTAGKGGNIFTRSNNATMNGGTIEGGTSTITGNVHGGGNIYCMASASKFTMNGGTIKNGTAAGIGGNICVRWGKFIMNDGEISNTNEQLTAKYGGNIAISYHTSGNTSVNINGGTITGGCAEMGGGIYAGQVLVMTGGTVTGGHVTNKQDGGGIYIADVAAASITVSGEVRIVDNTAEPNDHGETVNDIFMAGSKILNIAEAGLTGEAYMTLRVPGIRALTNSATWITEETASHVGYFTPRYKVIFDAANNYLIQQKVVQN